jgi:hypothetical protein
VPDNISMVCHTESSVGTTAGREIRVEAKLPARDLSLLPQRRSVTSAGLWILLARSWNRWSRPQRGMVGEYEAGRSMEKSNGRIPFPKAALDPTSRVGPVAEHRPYPGTPGGNRLTDYSERPTAVMRRPKATRHTAGGSSCSTPPSRQTVLPLQR